MALALVQPDDDARFDLWVPAEDAARLLGVNRGHFRRRCAETYEKQGLAQKVDGKWVVSPRLDERLQVKDPRQRDRESAAELATAGVPSKQIDKALAIRDLLANFHAFDSRGMTAHEARENFLIHAGSSGLLDSLGFDKRPGLRTFYTWDKKYTSHGLAGLVRKSAASKEIVRGEAALAFIEQLVKAGNSISVNGAITIAHGEAVKHPGDPAWEIPSYSKVRLIMRQRMPKIAKLLINKGERTARALAVPHKQRKFEDLEFNDEWFGDECTLDIMYRVLTERGWRARRKLILTAWEDARTRVITGAVLSEWADSNTILASLKCGFRDYGLPRIIRNDWGNDYKKATGKGVGKRFKAKGYRNFDGQRIASVLERLGVDVHPVIPYRPQSKPIESFFSTLHGLFDKQFASYWGGSSELRHEDRQKWVQANLEKLPTLDELCELLPIALDTYHSTRHGAVDMFGKTPREAMASFAPASIRRESESVLNHLFLTFVGPKTVLRDGIRHNKGWYRNPLNRQVELLGEKVLLAMQPDDQGKAMVCRVDDDRTPLFEVECVARYGMTDRDVKQHARDQAAILKPFRTQSKAARRAFEKMSPRERLELQRAGTAARYGVELPKRGEAPSTDAPTTLRLQSDLEQAISKADRIRDDEASEAIRTGTDDFEITLDDMLDDDPPPPSLRRRNDDTGMANADFFGIGDPEDL